MRISRQASDTGARIARSCKSPQRSTNPCLIESRGSTQNEAANEDLVSVSYADLSIIKPSYDQGVTANDGSVTIYLSLKPGHSIMLKVDGKDGERIYGGEALNFNLSKMSRGRHTVAARVVDQKGEELIRTGPVGFYVLRAALGGRAR